MNEYGKIPLNSMLTVFVGIAAASGLSATEPTEVPVGQRQLFLDDFIVESQTNLTKTMNTPRKMGAVIRPDQPWEQWLETRCVPAWDEKQQIYRIWMTALSPSGYAGNTYAESTDGIHWSRPVLRQCMVHGSSENNFFTVDPRFQWPASIVENVVHDPYDPDPGRRYKGFVGAEYRQPIASPDGIHWTQLDVPGIPSMDESNLSYDPLKRMFIATTKFWGPSGRSHAIWTSTDFNKWTRLDLPFQADEVDQRLAIRNSLARQADSSLQQVDYNPSQFHADIYNVAIFRYEGLYVALPAVYHATSGTEPRTHGFDLIELASSRDLQTWQRLPEDRQPFIGPSPIGQGVYDLTQILPPSAPVIRGNELWFYYIGHKYREIPQDADPKHGAVCLAVLRRDGFISFDADAMQGTLQTKPFVVQGTSLSVNVDATQGFLKAEVLDSHQKVVMVSDDIAGDQPQVQVSWNSSDFSGLAGQTVSLRFTLRQAKFYSFWLEE